MLDPSLTRAIPERLRDQYRTQYKALYKCPVYLKVRRTFIAFCLATPATLVYTSKSSFVATTDYRPCFIVYEYLSAIILSLPVSL